MVWVPGQIITPYHTALRRDGSKIGLEGMGTVVAIVLNRMARAASITTHFVVSSRMEVLDIRGGAHHHDHNHIESLSSSQYVRYDAARPGGGGVGLLLSAGAVVAVVVVVVVVAAAAGFPSLCIR